jgi:hypothetical protein
MKIIRNLFWAVAFGVGLFAVVYRNRFGKSGTGFRPDARRYGDLRQRCARRFHADGSVSVLHDVSKGSRTTHRNMPSISPIGIESDDESSRSSGTASRLGFESFLGARTDWKHWQLVMDLDGIRIPFRKQRVRISDQKCRAGGKATIDRGRDRRERCLRSDLQPQNYFIDR